MRSAGHTACIREMRNACDILVGTPEGNRALGKARLRYEDDITLSLMEVRWKIWTEFIWLRIGTSNGSLLTW
jgi:hypothetical protein